MKQKSRISHVIALVGVAAVILALIITVAPATKITIDAQTGEISSIDIFGLTKDAADLPEQQFAAF
jgi:hypothetical protein